MTDPQADLTERAAAAIINRWLGCAETTPLKGKHEPLRDGISAALRSEREAAETALQRVADALGVDCIFGDGKDVFVDGPGDRPIAEYITHIKKAAAAEARRAAIEECAKIARSYCGNENSASSRITESIAGLASPAPQEEEEKR